MPPLSAPTGLLVSQIAYDRHGAKRALLRGPASTAAPDATWIVERADGTPAATGQLKSWGEAWQSHWWIADFSALDTPGHYRLRLPDGPATANLSDPFEIADDALFRRTWKAVSVDQAERRQWMIASRIGWFDAGMHWQEANSHAAYLLGLAELLDARRPHLPAAAITRLETQLLHGARYLAQLQDLAAQRGSDDGAVVHQSFRFDHVILRADAAKAAAAWARVAVALGPDHATAAADFRTRAQRALLWLQTPSAAAPTHFNALAYGETVPAAIVSTQLATTDLVMMLEAAVALDHDRAEPAASTLAWARELAARQVPAAAAADHDGLHGLFRQYPGAPVTTKAWTHGMLADTDTIPADLGNTHGLYLFPLCRLLDRHPTHPEAPAWRACLEAFAYGYLAPACARNPFLLCPNGHFPGQGALHFAGLWHGCNTHYGLAAALARDCARLFADPQFDRIADANQQWIAGLNAGLTADSLHAAILCQANIPSGTALPVSMIHGIGHRTAGSWLNIRGSICNGFATGQQFQWDVPPLAAHDAPASFTDEDWITHAGAWLMAIARPPAAHARS